MRQAYHNSKTLKFEHLFEISEHERLDRYRQGNYWRFGKGCSIGCSVQPEYYVELEIDIHEYLESVYDIPKEIYHMADSIFEGLSFDESKTWTMRYSSAIKEGVDYSYVWPEFAYWMLVDDIDGVINAVGDKIIKNNIKVIAENILLDDGATNESNETERQLRNANNIKALEIDAVYLVCEAHINEIGTALYHARETIRLEKRSASMTQKQADKLIELIKNKPRR